MESCLMEHCVQAGAHHTLRKMVAGWSSEEQGSSSSSESQSSSSAEGTRLATLSDSDFRKRRSNERFGGWNHSGEGFVAMACGIPKKCQPELPGKQGQTPCLGYEGRVGSLSYILNL